MSDISQASINPETFKSGFVTLIGRPSSGKSTLLNALMGKKLAIASPTAQTTRHRFRAVHTTDTHQMIIVDTPGVHKPHDTLGEELNTTALKSLDGIDVVAFLLDSSAPFGKGDEWIIEQLKSFNMPKVLVLSKIDLVAPEQLEEQRFKAVSAGDWSDVVELSSTTGQNLDLFSSTIEKYLPVGPLWFPTDMETDQPVEVIIAEFIREKILLTMHDEVPHAVGVVVEDMEYNRRKNIERIYASVYVERDSQKGIIIGKGGNAIKEIGSQARKDLETLLGKKVFLDLQVKVRKNWRRDLNQIRRFGYGEGA
ncbi:MAG TPA: GTPase Era [Eggerthellaceae bacterium]|nr:GTPase Era [Eggerthellaceae bacterium]